MRTALIAAILFAGLLNCAYSAPQPEPQPDEDTEAVLQELQTVLEQGGAPTPEPTQFLCTKSGNAEAQFLGTALHVANAVHRAWNDREARDQWLTRKHVGTALRVANAAHKAWNNQLADAQGADQELVDEQGNPAIVKFSCTPVKVNSNGEVTFLDLE